MNTKTEVNSSETLFVCIHVPEFEAQALLRLRPSLRRKPIAVLDGTIPYECVCAGNVLARREGLRNGMTRVEAESCTGALVLLHRSKSEERVMHAVLLGCLRSFAPEVEVRYTNTAALCVLEIASTSRFRNDPRALGSALAQALRNRGFQVSIAFSVNFHAACALAQGTPGITVAAPGEEQRLLAPLLLDTLAQNVLCLTGEQAQKLSQWGIRTLGSLATLPPKELIAHMGQSGKRLRELARGEHPHGLGAHPSAIPVLASTLEAKATETGTGTKQDQATAPVLLEPPHLNARLVQLRAMVGTDRAGSPVLPESGTAIVPRSRHRPL